jgi:hypothetical protein
MGEVPMEEYMPAGSDARRDKRVLRIAIIAFVVIEALAMVPLIIHLANR